MSCWRVTKHVCTYKGICPNLFIIEISATPRLFAWPREFQVTRVQHCKSSQNGNAKNEIPVLGAGDVSLRSLILDFCFFFGDWMCIHMENMENWITKNIWLHRGGQLYASCSLPETGGLNWLGFGFKQLAAARRCRARPLVKYFPTLVRLQVVSPRCTRCKFSTLLLRTRRLDGRLIS